MVVGPDGSLSLPWLGAALAQALASQRGHALLVHAAEGNGALAFTLTLAQAWLCEAAAEPRPCGRCGSCRLIQSHLHPDLRVLMPEALRREHGWPLADDKADGDDSRRKPSRQIRIDEVRDLIDWTTRTPSRSNTKVAVLHPAESANLQSANALLKTLEEPPAGTRLILSCADPALLLPTVRSRCQIVRLGEPPADEARRWLVGHGVGQPEVLLVACGGRPLDALLLSQAGITADHWLALPAQILRSQAGGLSGWPLRLVLDALQKLCHDAMSLASGGAPRYFPAASLPPRSEREALMAWWSDLARVARHAGHAWHEPLLLDALVSQGSAALSQPASQAAPFDTLPG